ncbi:MAG: primosomal protein N' [Pygmaiobacter massiliensis]|nr:primosomal protein N' [Pygmaiobacter massiliensis]
MQPTVQVAVENANLSFDKCYDYRVPAHLADRVGPGSLVLVPFGRPASRARMGVVLSVGEVPDDIALKSIYDAAPEIAKLTPELVELVQWLKEYTFCTYYEAVRAVIPYGAQYRAVQGSEGPRLERQLAVRTVRWYSLLQPLPEKLSQKQKAVASLLCSGKTLPASQICQQAQVTESVLKTMVRRGMLQMQQAEKDCAVYENYCPDAASPELSCDQKNAFRQLAQCMEQKKGTTALLYGVTGSGKTLVFVELIRKAVASGRQCLVLVPEIGLTPQMIYRLKAVFGERVAVQHSALSNTERLGQWQQIQQGQADIVVGTRSAVFAPLERLGLIIIDEEQEQTYASENSPRYSALEVAKNRAMRHGCLLVLSSATPRVEDYKQALAGQMKLVTLPNRYNALPLPAVELLDMRKELAQGNAGSISSALAQAIGENLAAKKQTILLLNRRGYRTVALCADCGQVVKCPMCSVPMVLHKNPDRLLCHYCAGQQLPAPQVCPACGGRLRFTGFGTQRVEEELQELFPSARILRLDTDTTQKKNSHEKLLADFAAGRYDLMLGTQMVAKGLDFPNVSLVGVLGIDQMLFAQSYRAFERVFSLVCQVVGRSGRALAPGRAIIQTVDPEHPILNLAACQDYPRFYQQEIAMRKLSLYPPFCSLCLALFIGEREDAVSRAARLFSSLLSENAKKTPNLPLRLLGPVPASISMLSGKYRYKLTIKCRNDHSFRELMRQVLASYRQDALGRQVTVTLDFHSDCDV